MEEPHKTGNKHTIDNLDWSGWYLGASMYLPLLIRFLTHVNVAASEHEIISALILTICASKFEILDKVKDKLAAT